MVRMNNNERSLGPANAVKYYAGTNFPATMYICRFGEDNELGVPEWITSEFADNLVRIRGLVMADSQDFFECYYKQVRAAPCVYFFRSVYFF